VSGAVKPPKSPWKPMPLLPPLPTHALTVHWRAIEKCGRGTPALAGAAARAYACACGIAYAPGTAYLGTGELAHLTLFESELVEQLANMLRAKARAAVASASSDDGEGTP